MDRTTIRNHMIERIILTLEEYIDELDIADLIDEEVLNDFLWEKDYGRDIVIAYTNEHTEELVQEFLEGIYNEIDTEDLECPF